MTRTVLKPDAVLLERPEAATIWELRSAWARNRTVRLSLSDRCVIATVIGMVQRIAVTGAYVEIDGWHVPAEDILSVGYPLLTEIEEYRKAKDATDD